MHIPLKENTDAIMYNQYHKNRFKHQSSVIALKDDWNSAPSSQNLLKQLQTIPLNSLEGMEEESLNQIASLGILPHGLMQNANQDSTRVYNQVIHERKLYESCLSRRHESKKYLLHRQLKAKAMLEL